MRCQREWKKLHGSYLNRAGRDWLTVKGQVEADCRKAEWHAKLCDGDLSISGYSELGRIKVHVGKGARVLADRA